MKAHVIAALCRWTARVFGTLLIVILLTLAIGEGLPNPLTQPAWSQIIFLGFFLIMVGILVGWRWELAGGIISLTGFCVSIIPMKNNSACGLTWFYLALALPGVLYLASALLRRSNQQQRTEIRETEDRE